jgi:hypothetical protein
MNADDLAASARVIILPALGCVFLLAACTYAAVRIAYAPRIAGEGPMLVAFVTLGVVTGQIAGYSREPVIGAFLPGLLTLIGGLLTYIFAKDSLEAWRPLLPFCLIGLTVGGLLGLTVGSTMRAKAAFVAEEAERARKRYEIVVLEVEKAQHLARLDIWKHDCTQRIDLRSVGKPVEQCWPDTAVAGH